ncbi:MAG: CotH kinase family protein, partial [Verrucomicrobiota bacterium]
MRYTTDGSDPTAASPLYTGPINLTGSTELKARVFAPGVSAGPVGIGSYVELATSSNFGGLDAPNAFSSDLPVIVIENFNDGGFNTSALKPAHVKIFEPDPETGRTDLNRPPDQFFRAGFRIRGASSAGFPKKQYRVEVWNEDGDQIEVPSLGLPEEADWIFGAPYVDESLFRNPLVFSIGRDLGLEAPRTRHCEVFLNTGGGQLESDDYVGVYYVAESIKRDNNRIDIARLDPSHDSEPEITGGYIIRHEASASEGPRLAGWDHLEVAEPNSITATQLQWISTFVDDLSVALNGPTFKDPVMGYRPFIDVPSFVNTMVINELAREQDSYVR